MDEINHVCSLGTLCHTASLLKKNNLKKESYPFDWIFSDLNLIKDCLKNNFIEFLNKNNYSSAEDKKCFNLFYNKTVPIFNHHNPLIDMNDYNYFVRCVDRFNKILKSQEKKLFLMMFVNLTKENDNLKILQDFNAFLNLYTDNYYLLILNCYNLKNNVPYHKNITIDNLIIIDFYSTSLSNGTNFLNEMDNEYINNILNNFNFNIL